MYDAIFLRDVEAGLRQALPDWGLSAETPVRLLTISENATFLVGTADGEGRRIFRVQRPNAHRLEEVLSELAWVTALHEAGNLRVARPLPRRDGALVGSFQGGGATRNVVAFEYIEGSEPEPSGDMARWFRKLGEINAHMHQHSRNWRRPASFIRKIWDFDTMLGARPHWGPWSAGLDLDDQGLAIIAAAVELIRRRLAAFGDGPDRFGLVHADLRLANLLVSGEQLSVIDFDDCGDSWFMYDFAAAVSFHEHEPFVPALQTAWVAGYREVAALDDASEAMLPVFVMLRRILLMAWIASHRETPTAAFYGPGFTLTTVAMARDFVEREAR